MTGDRTRAQSHVVGVVVLVGLSAVAMGGLTVVVGELVDEQTGSADAARVSSDLQTALRPVETTGHREGSVTFGEGSLAVKERQFRVFDGGGLVRTVETDALVFSTGESRVAYVAGAVVRGSGENAWLEATPPLTSGPDVLVVGAPRLNGTGGVGGSGGVSATLRTNVSHDRRTLGRGQYRIAIETAVPRAFEGMAEDRGVPATVRDLDGDGVPSVVLDFGRGQAYLVVHDMRLEVTNG